MPADTKPLATFSWRLKTNTGLVDEGKQENVTPAMYGAVMGALAGNDQATEVARLQAEVAGLKARVAELTAGPENRSN